jgi:hypothetical protein
VRERTYESTSMLWPLQWKVVSLLHELISLGTVRSLWRLINFRDQLFANLSFPPETLDQWFRLPDLFEYRREMI